MAAALAAAVLMAQPVAAASLKETASDQLEKTTTQLEVRILPDAAQHLLTGPTQLHGCRRISRYHHSVPACLWLVNHAIPGNECPL